MTKANMTLPTLMTTRELAEYLRIKPGAILKARVQGGHPLFAKGFLMGNQLRFYADDVLEYVSAAGGRNDA